jgi:hypothetical protein
VASAEGTLATALRPWEQQLVREAIGRWLIRGAIGGLALVSLVLIIGWVTPWPEAELRPWAVELALPVVLVSLLVALWPIRKPRRAAELDARLGLGDRLATAWAFRHASQSIVDLQRSDAIARLKQRSPEVELRWRPARTEIGALLASGAIAGLLLITPSPQQTVLDRQASEQASVQAASDRLDALRQEAAAAPSLTPEQARQLDELLQQAQAELNRVRTQQEATAILASTQDQINQQLADPNADLRDEALAAMSETLAAEPLARTLADALRQEDAQATSAALKSIQDHADQLSDVQRQALSRALQRASNVGRSDPKSSAALGAAARALGSGDQSQSQSALSDADAALGDAVRSANQQASLRDTTQKLRDLQALLASGAALNGRAADQPTGIGQLTNQPSGLPGSAGTPVAVDAAGGGRLRDPSAGPGSGAGTGGADMADQGSAAAIGVAAENVFVPGREGSGAAYNQDVVDQPFTVRGAPRPYREVLSRYAQSGRDYVDRPDISPAVRDLVKQYFQQLEDGQ